MATRKLKNTHGAHMTHLLDIRVPDAQATIGPFFLQEVAITPCLGHLHSRKIWKVPEETACVIWQILNPKSKRGPTQPRSETSLLSMQRRLQNKRTGSQEAKCQSPPKESTPSRWTRTLWAARCHTFNSVSAFQGFIPVGNMDVQGLLWCTAHVRLQVRGTLP